MPNIGPLEIAIVLIIALIIFGPSKLPELGKSAGKGFREFKDSITGNHDDEAEKPVVATRIERDAAADPELVDAEVVAPSRS